LGKGNTSFLTPVKAIREKCVECQGGARKAVRDCAADCPLHPYRMGRNPNRAGIGPGMGPRSSSFSPKPHSRVGRSSSRIDSGEEGQGVGSVSNLPASKRRRVIRAAEAFLREIQGTEFVDGDGNTKRRSVARPERAVLSHGDR